ncbi:hypothetical protein Sjap_012176 [Stephania japonica]|uniref:Pentatricopeptide repeat-containing protein n=1 Tax=Stephania japonica TaxID=461633 RepID=A0AAP0NY11_9MAGN
MFFASSIITRRVVRLKFGFLGCPFGNFGSICSNFRENQDFVILDDAQYSKSDDSKWEFTESNGVFLTGKEIVSFYSCESSVFGVERGECRETNGVSRIKSALVGCGWDLERNIELDELNMVRILNDLYDGSSSATLSFFFYGLCETYAESKHRVRSVCTMVHILVAGNMNHKAVSLPRFLISKCNCSDDWHCYLFDVIEDTRRDRRVLEIVYSMLVGCYVRENMVVMAVKFVNRMKVVNVFPDIGVCNSLIKALLKLKMMELAWELFEEMLKRGMGNTCIVSLFIHQHCAEGLFERRARLLFGPGLGIESKWRSGPGDPTLGQGRVVTWPLGASVLQHEIAPIAKEMLKKRMDLPVEEACQTAPMLDIIQGCHRRMESLMEIRPTFKGETLPIEADGGSTTLNSGPRVNQEKWTPPPEGWIKCNVNAYFILG